ncbi:MAG: PAS domain-containing protein [Candidatus Zixiibacteriota bacterium]|nr:MAG: PAS domain-containing protein [candidate division Zixibacteria bacterium]
MDNIYREYFAAMPCFLTVQDRDFRIIEANRSFLKNFGDPEGRFCYQVYKHRPEKCEVCPVERTFRNGEPYYSEELVKTLDGREVWVIVNTTPIRDEAGKIVAVMEMSTDITEIKLLQKQLSESQERYRLLFEEVPCYISIQDKDLRIVDANRFHRDAFGTSYGSKCYEVYKHRTTECQPCIVRQTFKDGKSRTHEEVVTSRNNERINVLVCTAPIRDGNGEIEKVVEMSTDITQIRQLQDKLTSVGLLIGSISHGIKGLLNGLDGGIYLVNSGLMKNERERIDRGWEIALRNVDRIRSMVMDILYYAKDREPDWQSISTAALLDDVCGVMKEKAGKLGIDFVCHSDPGIGDFEGDPQAVRSLLVNLIENSMDACRIDTKKSKHKIAVKVSGDARCVQFDISDNGIGMDRETREKAFSLFFSSKGAGGTGLGLFISNKIAQAHGGNIVVESTEGEGSHFVVKMVRKRSDDHKKEVVSE